MKQFDVQPYDFIVSSTRKNQILALLIDLNIKLVCIGNLEELKENYKVLGKDSLEIILNLIVKEKELWSNW